MAVYTLTFGKYKGQTMEEVYKRDPEYVGWLANNSYVAPAKRAANAIIAAGARQDDEADDELLTALKQIARSKPHPNLKRYGHINTEVHKNFASIGFCTHAIHSSHGMSEMFFSEDWDIVEIRNAYDDGGDYDEDDEYEDYPRPRPVPVHPSSKAEDAIWYALPDNSGLKPLNAKPVTLAEAVEILEAYLAQK